MKDSITITVDTEILRLCRKEAHAQSRSTSGQIEYCLRAMLDPTGRAAYACGRGPSQRTADVDTTEPEEQNSP